MRGGSLRTISHFAVRMDYMTGLLGREVLNGDLVDVLLRHCCEQDNAWPRLGRMDPTGRSWQQ